MKILRAVIYQIELDSLIVHIYSEMYAVGH